MTAILEANDICKTYEGKEILKNISLELIPGAVHVLLGPSGSGKTSLLRILAGLLDPDGGQVRLDGQPLEGPKDRLVPGYEEISIAHQDFKLKHKMTVRENIRYELLGYTKDYQQERIETLLGLFRIQHLSEKDISLLSGGEKQRVAIARAMAHEPDVLLMDEPFSNLDLGTKSALLSEIRTLARETETAILLVTHDTRDALEVADVVSVLYHGHIIRQAPPQEIYDTPQYEVVANLFGPFNVIHQSHFESFGIVSDHEYVGVWPEHLIPADTNGTNTQVIHSVFMGHYWKQTLQCEEKNLTQYTVQKKDFSQVAVSQHFPIYPDPS